MDAINSLTPSLSEIDEGLKKNNYQVIANAYDVCNTIINGNTTVSQTMQARELRSRLHLCHRKYNEAIEDALFCRNEHYITESSWFTLIMAHFILGTIKDAKISLGYQGKTLSLYKISVALEYLLDKEYKRTIDVLPEPPENHVEKVFVETIRAAAYQHIDKKMAAKIKANVNKQHHQAACKLADVYFLKKDYRKVIELLQDFGKGYAASYSLAKSYFALEDFKNARVAAENFISQGDNALGLELMEQIEKKAGKDGTAFLYSYRAMDCKSVDGVRKLYDVAVHTVLKNHDLVAMNFLRASSGYTEDMILNLPYLLEQAKITPQRINLIENFQGFPLTSPENTLPRLAIMASEKFLSQQAWYQFPGCL